MSWCTQARKSSMQRYNMSEPTNISHEKFWNVWLYDGICVFNIQVPRSEATQYSYRYYKRMSRDCTSRNHCCYNVPRIRTPHTRSGCYAPRESDQALGICHILSALHIPVRRWISDDGRRQGYIYHQGVRRPLLCPCDRRTGSIFWSHHDQCGIEWYTDCWQYSRAMYRT